MATAAAEEPPRALLGGINRWYWNIDKGNINFIQDKLIQEKDNIKSLNNNILVAYCGIPHVSSDVNKKWVNQFLSGENHDKWKEIVMISNDFSESIKACNYETAASLMNKETLIRLSMTPDVLDKTGTKLFKIANNFNCGARFTGAGAGGCIWAIGKSGNIKKLKLEWQNFIDKQDKAKLLDTAIDEKGIIIHS